MDIARFQKCKSCERNAHVGFSGPPECDLQVVPEPDGSCPHHTTEIPSTDKIEMSVPVAALRAILPTLKRVAAHSRFDMDYPVLIGLGPGKALLCAVNSDTYVRYAWVVSPESPESSVTWMGVMPWSKLSALVEGDSGALVIKNVDGQVSVGNEVAPAILLPAEEIVSSPATGPVYSMRLGPPSPFLMKAMADPARARLLPYALLELPAISLVTTDAQRLHVEFARDNAEGPRAPVETALLLTKEQLSLLLEDMLDKALQRIEGGCRVTGLQHGFHVEMDFRAATGAFPDWRAFLNRPRQIRYPMALADLLQLVNEGGPVRLPNGPRLERSYVRDALVDWEGPHVTIGVVSSHAPAIFYGEHRAAVIMYATELQESAPAAPAAEAPSETVNDAETAPVQTSASPATPLFRAGDVIDGPEGPLQIVKAQVWCLVQMPNGKKQWFTAPGLAAYLGGEAVAA